MVDRAPDEELIQELADEVVLDTPILDRLQQTSLPLRGEFRQRALQRARLRIKQRRTPASVGTRAANIVTGPIMQSIDEELRFVVEERVQNALERRFED